MRGPRLFRAEKTWFVAAMGVMAVRDSLASSQLAAISFLFFSSKRISVAPYCNISFCLGFEEMS